MVTEQHFSQGVTFTNGVKRETVAEEPSDLLTVLWRTWRSHTFCSDSPSSTASFSDTSPAFTTASALRPLLWNRGGTPPLRPWNTHTHVRTHSCECVCVALPHTHTHSCVGPRCVPGGGALRPQPPRWC